MPTTIHTVHIRCSLHVVYRLTGFPHEKASKGMSPHPPPHGMFLWPTIFTGSPEKPILTVWPAGQRQTETSHDIASSLGLK